MAPIGGLPLGPVVLLGEVGLAGHLEPIAEIQLGPICLSGVRAVVNPLTASYSARGNLTAVAAASLGAEVRGGLRGALSLTAILPIGGEPAPISISLIWPGRRASPPVQGDRRREARDRRRARCWPGRHLACPGREAGS